MEIPFSGKGDKNTAKTQPLSPFRDREKNKKFPDLIEKGKLNNIAYGSSIQSFYSIRLYVERDLHVLSSLEEAQNINFRLLRRICSRDSISQAWPTGGPLNEGQGELNKIRHHDSRNSNNLILTLLNVCCGKT